MNGRKSIDWRWILVFWSSGVLGSRRGSVIRDWNSWRNAEAIARMLIPSPITGRVKRTAGWLRSTPKTTELMHGMTWPAALSEGEIGQFRLISWTPKTRSIAVGLKFWRPELKTEYIGIRSMNWRIRGRQPWAGFTPRSL